MKVKFDAHFLVLRDNDGCAVRDNANAEFFENHADFTHIGHADIFDSDFGVCRCGEADIRAYFEVIRSDSVFGSMKATSAMNGERV